MNLLSPRRLFFFEKWYFDAQADDGRFWFACVSPLTLLGHRSVEIFFWYFPPDGPPVHRMLEVPGRSLEAAADRSAARFAAGHLALGDARCHLALHQRDVELEAEYRPLDPPWVPGGDGILLERGAGRLLWTVPVPRAEVTLAGRVGALAIHLEGLGYADFVQTTMPPWRLPLRELLWGRALGRDAAFIWDRATFAAGAQGPRVESRAWLRIGDAPGRAVDALAPVIVREANDAGAPDRWPEAMDLRCRADGAPELAVSLDRTRLLMAHKVADLAPFGGAPVRALYRAATGDPVTYKLFSRTQVPGAHAPLHAAHERVVWGRGRARP